MAPTGFLNWNGYRFDFFADGKIELTRGSGASPLDEHTIWDAFSASPTFINSIFYVDFHNQHAFHRIHGSSGADVITKTHGGGIFAGGGNDSLTAYVSQDQVHDSGGGNDAGHVEHHIYAGSGVDTINLNFSTINEESYAWGHHVEGEGQLTRGVVDPLSKDIFNFQLSTVTNSTTGETTGIFGGRVVVGRLEDYDASRDEIRINGTAIDLKNLPPNMEIVYHNGSMNGLLEHLFDEQAWLVIRTGTAALGQGYVIYALEADRANPAWWMTSDPSDDPQWFQNLDADTPSSPRSTERHFISEAAAAEIVAQFNLAGRATFIDPQNFVPLGYSVQGVGEIINDYDTGFTSANALISGTVGGDLIAAGVNNDTVSAGDGNDRIWGGSGHDVLNGDAGNDSISGNSGNDVFNGGTGADTAVFLSGATVAVNLSLTTAQVTGEGSDTFVSIENVTSGVGNDTITGSSAANAIQTGDGHDLIFAGAGNDTVDGGAGNDTLDGGAGGDVLTGGTGTDTATYASATSAVLADMTTPSGNTGFAAGDNYNSIENLIGSSYADALIGNTANNALYGGTGNDSLTGKAGNDRLYGGVGNDELFGDEGADSLFGEDGFDLLMAGDGNDSLSGGAGNDTILGQNGADALTGGLGDDLFRYQSAAQGGDTITDFSNTTGNNDRFSIAVSGFGGGLVGGSLSASQFVLRTTNTNAAIDGNDRFIFNTVSNTLWFDVDGTGSQAAVLLATLQSTAPDLTAGDIWLFS